MKEIILNKIVVIAKLSDDTYRQVYLSELQMGYVMQFIEEMHDNKIKVCENEIKTIEF